MDQVILHLDGVEKPWAHTVCNATEFVTIERVVRKPINVSMYRAGSLPDWEPAFDTEQVWFILDYYDANLIPHYKQCAGPPTNPWNGTVNTNTVNTMQAINNVMKETYGKFIKEEMSKQSWVIDNLMFKYPLQKGKINDPIT
jgi:hypothetical protein